MSEPIILPFKNIHPKIHPTAFIAPGAVIIGDVEIGEDSSIWPGCVIRGDVNYIRIGKRTNIQDGTVIHVTRPSVVVNTSGQGGMTIIGDNITVGHKCMLHACTLEDECFVGMSSTVMDGAIVKKGGMVAGAAVITYRKEIPAGQIWAGNPAKFLRDMKQEEKDFILRSSDNYVNDSRDYLNG